MGEARRGRVEGELKGLFGYALALTGDRTLAEDLVQETALKALSARRGPSAEAAFRGWLFRILRNTAIDALRARQRTTPEAPEDIAERIDGAQSVLAAGEALSNGLALRFALARLKPAQREIIALVDIAGFAYAEAAELLELPVGTVMSRISRARAALAQEVAGSNVLPLPEARAAARRGG